MTELKPPPNKRPVPAILKVTDRAAERITQMLGKAERPGMGLRVGIKNGGCAGMEYTFELADVQAAGDERIEHKGAIVFVNPAAVLFLLGAEMDYQTSLLKSGFVFNNPNQTSACGCGESVQLQAAKL